MKTTINRLRQLISEELLREQNEPPADDYYPEDMNRGYDDLIEKLQQAMRDLSFAVIDEYKEHPSFNKESAYKEVADVIDSAASNFIEGLNLPSFVDLPTIIEDEFRDFEQGEQY